ncbi:MAG: pyrrolidone-carboxylate peptidase [Anaerolinea sp.]|nr:pyrrolidone-carboxylate peptidase [Anaerolinea sp.]
MRMLITGFNPFGKVEVNPSQLIVQRLAESRPDLLTLVLPTEYHAAADKICAALNVWRPDAVISLGVAQNRAVIGLERIAVNVDDASIPDNGDVLKTGDLIEAEGPIAYWSTLPLTAMLAALLERGIPAAISNHAGTFVCNHVFYTARHWVEQRGLNIPCGFIHVPGLSKTEGDVTTGMPLEQMVEAVEICLELLA